MKIQNRLLLHGCTDRSQHLPTYTMLNRFYINFLLLKYKTQALQVKTLQIEYDSGHRYEWRSATVTEDPSPDLRTVPGVLLPPPAGWPPGPGEPAFLVNRLLKKLASTPSLV